MIAVRSSVGSASEPCHAQRTLTCGSAGREQFVLIAPSKMRLMRRAAPPRLRSRWHSLELSLAIAFVAACGSAADSHGQSMNWRVVQTKYPTADVVVAGCTVDEFGAMGDGVTDDTSAIQGAMDAMAKAGGGTVFVPEGRYVIKGVLTVPTGVLLRGEWAQPSPVKGTVLAVYAGRGSESGSPFITLEHSSGIKELNIWYPEQNAGAIVPYPPCIVQKSAWHADDSVTVENVTLVNPYKGIVTGPGNSSRSRGDRV